MTESQRLVEPPDEISARASELFDQQNHTIHCWTDRLFAGLMLVQLLGAIGAALWISPEAWAGVESRVHLHVWGAILLGGTIVSLPVILALKRPGTTLTRHVIAVSQMIVSALLVHLTGGRIETHFHIFGSLAFLAFYRDWRVLLSATVIVAADHLVRGLYWPQSIFGVLTTSSWRWLEHAAWVLFEDGFLVASILQGRREMVTNAVREARLEASHNTVETTVRQRTAELAASKDRIKLILDRAMDAIITTDAGGQVTDWNPQATAVFGWSPPEALGRHLWDMILPDSSHTVNVASVDALPANGGQPTLNQRVEIQALRRDGTEFAAELAVTSVICQETTSFTVFARDITERKRTQQAMDQARQAALEGSRLKSEFLANMSHEIRTPMNGVIGMTGLLLDTELTPDQREQADTVRRSADALLNILNDILDLSKIEAGKMEIEPIDFDLQVAVEEVVELLAPRAAEKNVELIVRYAPEVPRYLVGDVGRIRQVLTNLAGNAIKFTQAGHVVFDVQRSESTDSVAELRFSIEDTGIGIPEHMLEHIFGKFTQADATTTRRFGGTGLGLAICKHLVELMGGTIGATSQSGHGSNFSFTLSLPLSDCAPEPIPPPADLHGLRVLIVDDNDVNRRVLHEQVTSWGMRNGGFASGPEALLALRDAQAQGDPYQVAILDYQMPGMDGEMLAAAIKGTPPIRDTVLVMVSSMGLRDQISLKAAGVAAYFVKPVRASQLMDALATAWAMRDRGDSTLITRHTRAQMKSAKVGSSDVKSFSIRARVLVAEDNTVNQMVALRMLEKLGCRVDVAANGSEAVHMLTMLPYDIVFMDCQMPEMDGYEATAAIRRMPTAGRGRIPIVAMTANAMQGDREKCLLAGMDDYVSKPIRAADLVAALQRWVTEVGTPSEPSPVSDSEHALELVGAGAL